MDELVARRRATPVTTSLLRVQAILSCEPEVARVIVHELEAAGYAEQSEGRAIRVSPTPHGGDVTKFLNLLQAVAGEAAQKARLVRDRDRWWSRGTPAREVMPLPDEVSGWLATHGLAAQTMVAVASEHGWYDVVRPFAQDLVDLWCATRQFGHALDALNAALDAETHVRQSRIAELQMIRARLLDAAGGRYDEALRAALSAVVSAWETGSTELVASAYQARAEVYQHGGHSTLALYDYGRVEALARRAVQDAPLGDTSVVAIDPVFAAARFDDAMRRLEEAAVDLAVAPDTQGFANVLSLLADTLAATGEADPAGIRIARFVKKATTTLPDAEAAAIAITVGHSAEQAGHVKLARTCYGLAAIHYTGAGQPHEAAAARERLVALDQADSAASTSSAADGKADVDEQA
ncbi:hypothetical protein KIPE111705_23415 [Kibdelosporangium persicum]|uniref:Uncharacterized protein n=1 Tax=Kibdelosporangium persicum TaxID=2698649 RepID=A0ABX2F353_9PSEU|nr:hypothetical protein [Kibdelosporangium persicum]NRN65764.1 hypothetical protein [Kibdelosporangium persicum]